jgi:hypothetical protein
MPFLIKKSSRAESKSMEMSERSDEPKFLIFNNCFIIASDLKIDSKYHEIDR